MNAWLAALAIVLAYVVMSVLDGPTDHSTEVAQAQALDDAHRADLARQRFERAAQAMCGDNAAWAEVAPGAVQCYTHRGAKTIAGRVQP